MLSQLDATNFSIAKSDLEQDPGTNRKYSSLEVASGPNLSIYILCPHCSLKIVDFVLSYPSSSEFCMRGVCSGTNKNYLYPAFESLNVNAVFQL